MPVAYRPRHSDSRLFPYHSAFFEKRDDKIQAVHTLNEVDLRHFQDNTKLTLIST
jgi:hypothetical protein